MVINETLKNIIQEVTTASKEIPFGNSKFQNVNLVISNELTEGRMYRQCLMRLDDKISALREHYYNIQLEDIDIEELQEKIKSNKTDKYEKRRAEVTIEKKMAMRISLEKLTVDCIEEINHLYQTFLTLPKMTRKEFEAEEQKHFELRLVRDATYALNYGSAQGQFQSLNAMGVSETASKMLKEPLLFEKEILKIRNNQIKIEEKT